MVFARVPKHFGEFEDPANKVFDCRAVTCFNRYEPYNEGQTYPYQNPLDNFPDGPFPSPQDDPGEKPLFHLHHRPLQRLTALFTSALFIGAGRAQKIGRTMLAYHRSAA